MTQLDSEPTPGRTLRAGFAVLVCAVMWALLPLTPDPANPLKHLILHWGLAALAAAWVAVAWRGRMPPAPPSTLTWLALALLGLTLLAAALASRPMYSLAAWRHWLALGLVFLLARQAYRTPAQVWRLFSVVGIAVFGAALYGLAQKYGLDPFPWETRELDEYRNLPSTFGNPNYAGHVLVPAIVLLGGLATLPGRRWAALLLVPCAMHLYFTEIRAGRLALLAALALVAVAWGIRRMRQEPSPWSAAASLAAVAVLGVVSAGALLAVGHIQRGVSPLVDASMALRYNSFLGAARMTLDKPVLGHGPGMYLIENPPYWTEYEQHWFAVERKLNHHVHNDFLETAVEAGLTAAALHLALMALATLLALRMAHEAADPLRRRLGYTFAAAFFACAVDALFGFGLRLPASSMLLFLLLGAFDGLHSAGAGEANAAARVSWRGRLAYAGLAVLALGAAVTEARVYSSEMDLQNARAAKIFGYPREAELLLRRAQTRTPWNHAYPWERARLLQEQGRDTEAIEAYREALEAHPHFIPALSGIAYTHLNRAVSLAEAEGAQITPQTEAELDKAAEHARKLIQYCPPFAAGHDVLGRAASIRAVAAQPDGQMTPESERLWLEARALLEQAVRLGADYVREVHVSLAQARLALGEPAQAEQALRRAALAEPGARSSWELFLRYAAAYDRYGAMLDTLETALDRLESEAPDRPEPRARLYLLMAAVQYNGFEDAAKAEEAYRAALELAPGSLEVWSEFSAYGRAAGRMDAVHNALRAFEVRQAREGRSLPGYLAIGAAALRAESSELPAVAGRLAEWSREQMETGNAEAPGAVRWLIEQVFLPLLAPETVTPADRGRVLRLLGIAFAEIGDWTRAEIHLERAVALLPTSEQAAGRVAHAIVLTQLDRIGDAIVVLREAKRQSPNDPSVQWELARLYAAAGQTAQARFEYTLLLQSGALSSDARRLAERELNELQL